MHSYKWLHETPQPSIAIHRLPDQLRERVRCLHYSLGTETACLYWVRFFAHWHGLMQPRDMGARDVDAFLSMLATQRHVAASRHRQAPLPARPRRAKNPVDLPPQAAR